MTRSRPKRVRQRLTVAVPCQYGGKDPHEIQVTTDERGLVLGVHTDCDHLDPGVDDVGVALAGDRYACCRYLALHLLDAIGARDPSEGPKRLGRRALEARMPSLLWQLTNTARYVADRQRSNRDYLRDRAADDPDPDLGDMFRARASRVIRGYTRLPLRVTLVDLPGRTGQVGRRQRLTVLGARGVGWGVLAEYIRSGLWAVDSATRDYLVHASGLEYARSEPCPVCPGGPKASSRHLQTGKHAEALEGKFLDALDQLASELAREKGPRRG